MICEVTQMTTDPDWSADLRRYGASRPFLREQSIWALWIYRFGRRIDRRPEGLVKRLLTIWYLLLFRWVETTIGVSLPKSVQIGPGLRIWHFGGIFIHGEAVIGSNCTLRQGVTIGNRHAGGAAPVLGNNVELGAYAQVLEASELVTVAKSGRWPLCYAICPMARQQSARRRRSFLRKTFPVRRAEVHPHIECRAEHEISKNRVE